jgi:hypothetical protein
LGANVLAGMFGDAEFKGLRLYLLVLVLDLLGLFGKYQWSSKTKLLCFEEVLEL